jgi:hypothetical protein
VLRGAELAGMFAASTAFAAWGLVMPDAPRTFTVTDDLTLTVWTLPIMGGAAGIVAAIPTHREPGDPVRWRPEAKSD